MDRIANVLNMTPLVDARQDIVEDQHHLVEYISPETGEVTMLDPIDKTLADANDDYVMVRQGIKDMIADSSDVFDTAKLEAVTSGDPKKIEAFSRVMDTIVKASKELMNVHKDMFGLQPPIKEETPKQQADTINNIIFTGNQADLFRLLKEKGVTSNKVDELNE